MSSQRVIPQPVQLPPRWSRLALAVAAGLVGYALNRFLPVGICRGIPLEPGGLASLFAAVWLGPGWGALAAGLAFAGTGSGWPHLWGIPLFAGEALVVGWLARKSHCSILTASLSYWAVAGAPLAAALILGLGRLPAPLHWIYFSVVPLSGILAALVLDLMTVMPVWRGLTRRFFPGAGDAAPLGEFLRRRFGSMAIGIVLTITIVSGHAYDESTRRSAELSLQNTARQSAAITGAYLTKHRQAIEVLARNLALDEVAAVRRAGTQLEQVRMAYPGFLTLLLAEESGAVAVAAPELDPDGRPLLHPGMSVADREYFRTALDTTRTFVSGIFRGRGFGQDLIVAISTPLTDAAGRRWLLEGSLRLEDMLQAVARPESLQGCELLLTDRQGVVVLAQGFAGARVLEDFRRPESWLGRQFGRSFHYDVAGGNGERPVRYHLAGEKVSDSGWLVHVQVPLWTELQSLTRFYGYVILGALLALVLSMQLARLTARELTIPLRRLSEAAAITHSGQPAEPIDMTGAPAEIAHIARDVHAAACRLAQTNAQLAQTNEEQDRTNRQLSELTGHLEERVQARTAELEEARQAAEIANRAKSEFLATMSHELRTPLHVILGMAEILADGSLGPLSPKQESSLRSIDESGRHLLELINDILDLSKVEAGKLELEKNLVDLNSVCEASLRLVRAQAESKRQTVELDFRLSRPQASVDGRRLKQILLNLLANAVKFTPPRGRLGLLVDDSRDGKYLRFTVWDQGVGISPEDQARLFQPFVQARSRLQREQGGTGLGLSLVKRMTELHGGTVTLESAPGHGSRFTVSLPGRDEREAVPVADQPVAPALSNPNELTALFGRSPPKVLIAEDNEINFRLLDSFLHLHGCRTLHAANGQLAMDAVARSRPQIILMDINMPVMDGLEATRRLKANPATATIPIIALTALAMEEDKARGRAAGVDAYHTKPVNLRLLGEEMLRLLRAADV